MTETLVDLLDLVQSLLWQGFVTFLRIGPMMTLLPAFGEQSVPMRVKLALGLCFTMIVAPAAPAALTTPETGVPALLLAETVVGLTIGIGIRMFVMALQTAGSIAAQATSLAQIFGGAASEPMPAMGHVLVVAGLALAVMSGLHVRVAELMIWSYEVLPLGRFPAPSAMSDWGVQQIARAFSLAFTLAAPFVIVSVLYNLTLGVINRAMPQLMVAFVGAPVITAGGLSLLFLMAPLMLSRWHDALVLFLANPFAGTGP
ncbi:flagellar biosynthetic protein FliR [Marimonas arenosa]|uniref:Flagellar biosynthetic protein FliR n=1 Tax=Marimonas arenosa TaxID=1795305 RepID=A0AAE3WF64_9RHOB|nr:flagellar biosynthetic protein FliR [Marimonas arenosa]MDQ2090565.1 flagellar biosynthetic protein FliR [Marimonas arenosa]